MTDQQIKAKADFLGLSIDDYLKKHHRDCPGSDDCQEFIDCAFPDCAKKEQTANFACSPVAPFVDLGQGGN